MSLEVFMRGLHRRFFWLLLFAVLGAVAAYFYLSFNSRETARVKVAVIEPALTRATKSGVQAQVTFDSVVQSQLLAQRVIDTLGLEDLSAYDLSQDISAKLSPTLIPNVITPLYIVEVKHKDPDTAIALANAIVEEGSELFLELNELDMGELRTTYEDQLTVAENEFEEALEAFQTYKQDHGIYDLKGQIALQTGILRNIVDRQDSELKALIYNVATESAQTALLEDLRVRRAEADSVLDDLGVKAADYNALVFELNLAEQLLQQVTTLQTNLSIGERLSNSSSETRVIGGTFGDEMNGIISPTPLSALQGQVSIQGTASDPQFMKYEVHVRPTSGISDWQLLGVYTAPVVNGELSLWDTSTFPDEAYSIRLRVVRQDANYTDYYAQPVYVDSAGLRAQDGQLATVLVDEAPQATLALLSDDSVPATRPVLEQALDAVDQAQANLLQYQTGNDATAIYNRVDAAVSLVNALQQGEWSILRSMEENDATREARSTIMNSLVTQLQEERQKLEALTSLQPEHDKLQLKLQLAQSAFLQIDADVRQMILDETTVAASQVKLLDQATIVPQGFSRVAIAVVATLTGLMIGLLMVYLLTYLDRTVREANEAGGLMDAPVLTSIPKG